MSPEPKASEICNIVHPKIAHFSAHVAADQFGFVSSYIKFRMPKKIPHVVFFGLVSLSLRTYTDQRRRGRVVEGAPLLRE